YEDYDGVAIECQGLPDSINHPQFPSVELRPGETYSEDIIFKFSTKN
ncbi:MAG: galactose-1-epimerase, partial [Muribaculaceae bacterium]|nr:galactose-1-epimerase [Muribaculaceae bacterium]